MYALVGQEDAKISVDKDEGGKNDYQLIRIRHPHTRTEPNWQNFFQPPILTSDILQHLHQNECVVPHLKDLI